MHNIPLKRLSAFYAVYFAILGAFLPYWSLYLKQTGFTAIEIGELTALLVATKIVAPNFWGWLADRSGKRLRLIRFSAFFSTLCFAGFYYQQDFWWYAVVSVGFSFFWNATLPQFEAATLLHLQNTLPLYSRIRLWGSVGFIVAVLGIGWCLDFYPINYLPAIILTLLASNWLLALFTPEVYLQRKAPATQGSWQVFGRIEILAFFTVYMLLQISHGPYYVFYSVYLQQHGYTATLTGLLWALGVSAEIVLFMFANRLLQYFSLRQLLLTSLLLTVLRWTLIGWLVDQPAIILFAQLLHAASFGCTHVVAIQWLSKHFGSQHQGKAQAFYASIAYGLGGMLGSLYSGQFWEVLGAPVIFAIAAFASGLALLIAFVGLERNKPFQLS